ncbi:Ferric iron ABC transporter, ATP-binding protein [hydrothermal vent metagenome]|uniref:Ferric iron ABC transporter, ATP-binding protein n=1 Tax=hydrothermal vent metagenome TaxID=652676 RepID=A0A3B1DPT8_9ZZZZ
MIRIENLSVQAGQFSLKNISFEVATSDYAILMGRTGCGKTTILEALCGLKSVTAGKIILDDRDVTHLKPAERGIGFVPQDGALFPTMTVRKQIGFSLALRKWKRQKIKSRVDELAEMLGVSHLLDRYPQGLSGGERQRIALGRALAPVPEVLCLDEPLSALDEKTRTEMIDLLKSIRQQTGVTTLHITHNHLEAELMADVLFVIEAGELQTHPLGSKKY